MPRLRQMVSNGAKSRTVCHSDVSHFGMAGLTWLDCGVRTEADDWIRDTEGHASSLSYSRISLVGSMGRHPVCRRHR